MRNKYPASDEFLARMQGLSGMLTKVRTEYDGIAEMVEHPNWDEGKTNTALRLITSLRDHLEQIERELTDHVSGKFGQD